MKSNKSKIEQIKPILEKNQNVMHPSVKAIPHACARCTKTFSQSPASVLFSKTQAKQLVLIKINKKNHVNPEI